MCACTFRQQMESKSHVYLHRIYYKLTERHVSLDLFLLSYVIPYNEFGPLCKNTKNDWLSRTWCLSESGLKFCTDDLSEGIKLLCRIHPFPFGLTVTLHVLHSWGILWFRRHTFRLWDLLGWVCWNKQRTHWGWSTALSNPHRRGICHSAVRCRKRWWNIQVTL